MEYNTTNSPRFRSASGKIRSGRKQEPFSVQMTTTDARKILNELYCELCKYDADKAEKICTRNNA